MLFTHNHPSGITEPSRGDELLTEHLQETLASVEVKMLDHIAVDGVETVSFAEKRLMCR